jgi:hypothetical protein
MSSCTVNVKRVKAVRIKPFAEEAMRKSIPFREDMTLKEYRDHPDQPLVFSAASFQEHADRHLAFLGEPDLPWGSGPGALPFEGSLGKYVFFRQPFRHLIPARDARLRCARERMSFAAAFLPEEFTKERPDEVGVFTLNRLGVFSGNKEVTKVAFDGNINYPVLARLKHGDCWEPWMSYTPSEVASQRTGIGAARGNVMLGGLGMGWLLRKVLERKNVKHVTVVECEPAFINRFGPAFEAAFPGRVEFVDSDAIGFAAEHHARFNSILMDIWWSYGDATWDRKWMEVRNRIPKGIRVWHWN